MYRASINIGGYYPKQYKAPVEVKETVYQKVFTSGMITAIYFHNLLSQGG